MIATSANFSYAKAGQRVATVKSSPFAVAKTELDATMSMLKERGPLLQARPIRSPDVAVLFTDAVNGDRARHLFEATVRQRLERLGVSETHILAVLEEEEVVSRAFPFPFPARDRRGLEFIRHKPRTTASQSNRI